MSKAHSYESQSRFSGLRLASSGWLLAGLVLIIGLSACAPQPEQSRPATASTSAPPTATTALQMVPTPAIVSTATNPAGLETRLGFNVRGWT